MLNTLLLNIYHWQKLPTTSIYTLLMFTALITVVIFAYNPTYLNSRKIFNFITALYISMVLVLVLLFTTNHLTNKNGIEIITSNYSFLFFDITIKPFELIQDRLTNVFTITILLIGISSNIYTHVYLNADKNKHYFLGLLNFFIFSMLILVNTNSLIVALLCWEGLGISSFFLINYYRNRPFSLKASFKAFSFNRLSDVLFFIFTVLYYFNTNTLDLVTVTTTPKIGDSTCFILLALTASLKSAQHIFFFWLPDSMEAPIPASALIHSATLVAAGIYLVLRLSHYFQNNDLISNYFIYSGIISAVCFSFVSLLQTDIKRLLAYSTIANCGFIYFLIGMGCYDLALYYFVVHGLFKSILFLIAGNLILSNNHNQDMQYWKLNHTNRQLANLMLIGFSCLSALNLSISFEIKHFISNSFSGGTELLTFTINFLFLSYTLNSMLYGLKLPIFFTNQSNNSKQIIVDLQKPNITTPIFIIYTRITAWTYTLLFGATLHATNSSYITILKSFPVLIIISLCNNKFKQIIPFTFLLVFFL